MAFCTKCGKALAEGEKCTCEASVPAEPAVQTAPTSTPEQIAKPKKKGTILIIGIAAIAIIAVAVIGLTLTSKPHVKPINDFVAAVNKQGTNPFAYFEPLLPDFAVKSFQKTYRTLESTEYEEYVDSYEETVETLEEIFEEASDEFEGWKLSFELKKETKLDDDEFETLQESVEEFFEDELEEELDYYEDLLDDEDKIEELADEFDITEKQVASICKAYIDYYECYKDLKVTDAYELKGKFIIKADGEEYDTDTLKFYVVKANNSWYYAGLSEGNTAFSDEAEEYFEFISWILEEDLLYIDSFYIVN